MTDVNDVVRRHWEERAAGYDDSPGHDASDPEQDAAWRALLARWAGARALDVVDVGCGTGFLALRLAALGHRVVGLDAAAAMRRRARDKAAAAGVSIDVRAGEATRLPLPDAAADLVVERHVLWTLPDPVAALREWARVLRPRGRLVLVEGQWGVSPDSPSAAAYRVIADRLPLYGGRPAGVIAGLAQEAGLTRVSVEPLDAERLWGEPRQGSRYAVHARRA